MNALVTCSIPNVVIENLSTAILLLDESLTLTFMNSAAEAMLGLSVRHGVGMPMATLFKGVKDAEDCMQTALREEQPYAEHELDMVLLNGSRITVDCNVTPIHEAENSAVLLVELVQVDRHLRINREESLLAQEKTVRALVRGMAHEIKNPLGGLRGAAQLLERELPSEELKEYTQVIIGEADRLKSLVNRMLGPKNEPKKAQVNILEVLEHVLKLNKADAPSGLRFVRDYDPSMPELLADKDMLIQAMLNILNNARQAQESVLKAGAEHATIILKTRPQRNFTIGNQLHRLVLKVDIIDDGPGIDPELYDQIFYPMVTSRAEGTGLGLPIAQSLINRHDGLIECSSEPGETRFSIYLPYVDLSAGNKDVKA